MNIDRFEWSQEPAEWGARVAEAQVALTIGRIHALLNARRDEIAQWMRSNAPWRDQTGQSRAGLHVELQIDGLTATLVLNYTPDERWNQGRPVGWFLEYTRGGQYEIIRTAIDVWFQTLLAEIEREVRG